MYEQDLYMSFHIQKEFFFPQEFSVFCKIPTKIIKGVCFFFLEQFLVSYEIPINTINS